MPGHPRREIEMDQPTMERRDTLQPPNNHLRASTVNVYNRTLRRTQSQPIPKPPSTNNVVRGGNVGNENVHIQRPLSQPLVNLDGYTTPLYIRQMHPIWNTDGENGKNTATTNVPQVNVGSRNTEVALPNAHTISMPQHFSPPPFVTQRDPPNINRQTFASTLHTPVMGDDVVNTHNRHQPKRKCNEQKAPVVNANQQLGNMLRRRQATQNQNNAKGNLGESSTKTGNSSHADGQVMDDPNTQYAHLFRRRPSNTVALNPSPGPSQRNGSSYVTESKETYKCVEPMAGPSHGNPVQPTYVRPSTSNDFGAGPTNSVPQYGYVIQNVGANSHEEMGLGCVPLELAREQSISTVCYQSSDESITFPCRPPDTRGNSFILEQLRQMGEKMDGLTTQMLTRKTDLEQQKRMLQKREKQLQDEEEERLLEESLLRKHREACKYNNC